MCRSVHVFLTEIMQTFTMMLCLLSDGQVKLFEAVYSLYLVVSQPYYPHGGHIFHATHPTCARVSNNLERRIPEQNSQRAYYNRTKLPKLLL
jgi:hypothetical protein